MDTNRFMLQVVLHRIDDVPIFSMEEDAFADVESGPVLSTHVTKASEHDTNYFQYVKGIPIVKKGATPPWASVLW